MAATHSRELDDCILGGSNSTASEQVRLLTMFQKRKILIVILSLYFGQAMMWSAVDYASSDTRRDALACTKRLSAAFPTEISLSIKLALHQLLFEDKRPPEAFANPETSRHRTARLAAILFSSANLESQPDAIKEGLIADLLLVSHHKDFGIHLPPVEYPC
jgi:hypothetical protein